MSKRRSEDECEGKKVKVFKGDNQEEIKFKLKNFMSQIVSFCNYLLVLILIY